jgi:hypothetical protein
MFGVRKPACLDLAMKPYKPLILQPVGHRYSEIQNCQDYSIFKRVTTILNIGLISLTSALTILLQHLSCNETKRKLSSRAE